MTLCRPSGDDTWLSPWAGFPFLRLEKVAVLFFGRECTILRLCRVKDFAAWGHLLAGGCSGNLHALRGSISLRVP